MLPSAAGLDGLAPEYAGGTVEIHEQPVPASGGLLDHEVTVYAHGLTSRDKRGILIQVRPAPLDEPEFGPVNKKCHRLAQEIDRGNEIGVENCNKLCIGIFEALLQRSGL